MSSSSFRPFRAVMPAGAQRLLGLGALLGLLCGARRSLPAQEPIAKASASPVRAQETACAAFLAAPTPDSTPFTLVAREQPADGPDLPAWYARLLGEGLRQELRLPNPLVLDTYNSASFVDEILSMARRATGDSTALAAPSAEVSPSLRGAYVVRLLPDGHLRDGRVIAGYRTPGLDAAVLGALAALDSSGELPPPPTELHVGAEGLLLRFDLGSRIALAAPILGDTSGVTPLFTLRLPRFRVQRPVMPVPFQQSPRYPDAMRANNISGQVRMWFVVDETGSPDLRTVHVVASSNPLFTRAVEDALRTMRFRPLTIGPGCPVRMPVVMPFRFTSNY